MIDKSNHVPLYIQLKDIVVDKIKSGKYEVDSQLPTEKEFMKIYHVGRATVREALSILANEGYLYKKQGIGTFVARKHPALGFESLISFTYPLIIRGITPKNLIEDERIIEADKNLLKKMKWNKKRECFYLKRLRFAGNSPIAIENSYFNKEFCNLEAEYDFTGSLAKIIVNGLNANITKIEQIVVPRLPDKIEKEKLMMEDNVLVMDIERWIYLDNNTEPFYYLKFVISGNVYSISL